ncbi:MULTISPECIES: hypothetical protein [Rhodomicrobium]|uniref:hypothetical protein n=1 Tax=Rhodomicrobium TaxID=1068 RepID=UPI000F7434BF|nr:MULTISPECIES: hypothetical protein [Rhodomicrobium]
MTFRNLLRLLALFLGAALGSQQASSQSFVETVQTALYAGKIDDAAAAARARLGASPGDAQAQFALGAAQFLGAVEKLGQDLYRYGLHSNYTDRTGVSPLPFLRLPVPNNPHPEPVSYDALRGVLQGFAARLGEAEATLAAVPDQPVDLPLNIGLIRLDLNGDQASSEDEALWQIFKRVGGFPWLTPETAARLQTDFDSGDVPWLRGYCNLLMGLADFILAHDWHEAFDATFQNLFPKSDLPSSPMLALEVQPRSSTGAIADLVAFVHLLHWPVVEPQRMQSALGHFEAMAALSRESWRRIMAETDTGRAEWIPNPSQTSVLPGMQVTVERVAGWQQFLGEFEALLQGRKLLPHYRFDRGLNLRRMFTEPRTFDIVLLIQGSAALPYLEEGELTSGGTWQTIFQLMGGDFFRYFVWFN